jgi:ABC-type bacteriocin/lantibiotic exporter with double-glycine peptidase domain
MPLPPELCSIELSDVSYYHGARVLVGVEDLSVHIEPGEFVQIIGNSGSGKSTLARLLAGYFEPHSGTASVAGRDVWNLPLGHGNHPVDLISTTSTLVSGPLFCSVASSFTATERDLDLVMEACSLIGIDRTVAQLPNGYRTWIGPNGFRPPDGLLQMLVLASALIRKAPILVMDEALNQLDDPMRDALREKLPEIMKHRTVVAIGRDIAFVPKRPRKLYLTKGRLSE